MGARGAGPPGTSGHRAPGQSSRPQATPPEKGPRRLAGPPPLPHKAWSRPHSRARRASPPLEPRPAFPAEGTAGPGETGREAVSAALRPAAHTKGCAGTAAGLPRAWAPERTLPTGPRLSLCPHPLLPASGDLPRGKWPPRPLLEEAELPSPFCTLGQRDSWWASDLSQTTQSDSWMLCRDEDAGWLAGEGTSEGAALRAAGRALLGPGSRLSQDKILTLLQRSWIKPCLIPFFACTFLDSKSIHSLNLRGECLADGELPETPAGY